MSKTRQTILVVDDAAMNRALLSDMLRDRYDVMEAADGAECVDIVQRSGQSISLILLDVNMPRMNGLECLRMMKEHGWIKNLPVIMVFADSDMEVHKQAFALGAADFILRPFDYSLVRKRIDNVISLYDKQRTLEHMMEEIAENTSNTANKPTIVESAPASKRTVDLLDYELMKYGLFAEMSNEIQFEYTVQPPVMKIRDYSEHKLGLPEVVCDPLSNEKVLAVFNEDDIATATQAILGSSRKDPIIQSDVLGNLADGPRWFHLEARAMWDADEENLVGCIGKLVDIHDSHKKLVDLEQRATRDSLTGLYNHAYARQVISARLQEHPESLFVMMVFDMDKFKEANDNHGHLFGDEVLKHLAKSITKSVRDNDIVARVGGDEFMICMETEVDPKPLVERIFKQCTGEYEGFPIALSMGVDIARGEDRTYDEMFKRADSALYEKKRNGRGGYVFSDEVGDISCDGTVISTIESDLEK